MIEGDRRDVCWANATTMMKKTGRAMRLDINQRPLQRNECPPVNENAGRPSSNHHARLLTTRITDFVPATENVLILIILADLTIWRTDCS